MEILVISHKYPPSIGGMQKQCFELVKGLKKNNKVHHLIHEHGSSKLGFLLFVSFRARSILKRYPNIDLVYANDGLMAFFLTPLFWMTKKPITVTIHGLDVVFPLGFYQKWVRKYLNRSAAVIAVSDGTTEEIKKREVAPERVFTVKNGFDPDFKPLELNTAYKNQLAKKLGVDFADKKILVSIGRSVKRKGFSWMVSQIMPQLEDVIYIIIGPTLGDYDAVRRTEKLLPRSLFNTLVLLDGKPLDEITVHEKIEELNLADRIFHVSDMSNDEVAQTLMLADLFVMPNLSVPGDYEGFGLVALEAVMSGTLSIASRVDGIPSAITEDKNGVLLEPGHVDQWLSTIKDLLADDAKRLALAEQYRNYTIENASSWEHMAMEYEQVFQKILAHS